MYNADALHPDTHYISTAIPKTTHRSKQTTKEHEDAFSSM